MHKKRQCLSRLKKAKITSGVPVAKVQNSHFATAAIEILVSRQLTLLPQPAKKCLSQATLHQAFMEKTVSEGRIFENRPDANPVLRGGKFAKHNELD